jgi:hypothetical protein
MSDTRLQYFINFQSLMLIDCPAESKGKNCYLMFKRGANELKTKITAIDQGGFAEFNEKIDMKTFIKFDKSTNRWEPKEAQLFAYLSDNTMLGTAALDLSDYAKPDKYLKQLTLSKLMSGLSAKSFINVEIRTLDANARGGGASSQSPDKRGNGTRGADPPRGSVMFSASNQTNKQLQMYQ